MVPINLARTFFRRMAAALSRLPKSVLWTVSAMELCAVIVLCAALAARSPALPPTDHPDPSRVAITGTGVPADCDPVEETYTVRWQSMEPMIRDGAVIAVSKGYYRCGGKVGRGDVVIYESSVTKGPVVKRVRALPGDAVSVRDGKLSVNGAVVRNSAGVPYAFGAAESLMISIYAPDGKLQEGAYLIFGDNVSNSTDSRKYGAVRAKDFVGKAEIPE